MSRHLKRAQSAHWKSRNYISRRTEWKVSMSQCHFIYKLISSVNPLLWGISKIEYHSLSNGKLKVIVTGMKIFDGTLLRSLFNMRQQHLGNSLNPFLSLFNTHWTQIELLRQSLPYNYLDPELLARSIAGRKVSKGVFGDIPFWSPDGGNIKNATMFGPMKNPEILDSRHVITGIRIEIKGITGKMTMSKKVIKTFGTLRFNSSDSIIDFGEASSMTARGIIGVKVWIAYKTVEQNPAGLVK
uniref:Small ribosomal subunit protein uS3m n=1 Tax=Allomyces macrogynus TaxID=28583 RepID=Q33766_ALLMA|nr:ribosomal protein S3 [Allomyces macrogynus]AAC49250.1 ribosomal protein S3 [Allomyces macrogynus]